MDFGICLPYMERDYGRAQELIKDNFISRSDFDRIQADYRSAKAALDQARAMLLGVLNAPMSQLVRTLAEPASMLARTFGARGEQESA